jgi:hypothetical protein
MTQKDTKRSKQYNALNDNNDCILHIRLNTVHRNRWIFRVKRLAFCQQYFGKFSRVADGFHSVLYLRLVFVSMDCVLVLVITFYYGLEVTQTSNGFNQSMDRMFHVEKEMVKDIHVQDWAPTIG